MLTLAMLQVWTAGGSLQFGRLTTKHLHIPFILVQSSGMGITVVREEKENVHPVKGKNTYMRRRQLSCKVKANHYPNSISSAIVRSTSSGNTILENQYLYAEFDQHGRLCQLLDKEEE
jgi:hypothetical protein